MRRRGAWTNNAAQVAHAETTSAPHSVTCVTAAATNLGSRRDGTDRCIWEARDVLASERPPRDLPRPEEGPAREGAREADAMIVGHAIDGGR